MKPATAIMKYFDDPDNGSTKPTVAEMKDLITNVNPRLS
jgi:hypothetical protein